MKTIILLFLTSILTINCLGQNAISTDSLLKRIEIIELNNSEAANGIDKFASRQGLAFLLTTFGTVTSTIGISENRSSLRNAGFIAVGFGIITWITSYSGLRTASKYLKGDKVVIPLNNKKSK